MTLSIQALTMLHMFGAGIYLGCAIATYLRFRARYTSSWVPFVYDILFWLGNGCIIFVWLQAINQGEMRFYIFLSLLCGYAFYQALLEHYYQRVLTTLIRMFRLIYQGLARVIYIMIIWPLKGIYRLILAVIMALLGMVVAIGHPIYKKTIQKRGVFKRVANWFIRKR